MVPWIRCLIKSSVLISGSHSACAADSLELSSSPSRSPFSSCAFGSSPDTGFSWTVSSRDVFFLLVFKLTNKFVRIFLFAAMGMGLCVAFIALVRLPSLKVSTLLLTGLLIYDVFWVFFSSYIFSTNVMVKVSNQRAAVLLF